MSDLAGRKVFKVGSAFRPTRVHAMSADRRQVFNQEFIVDERYNVTKELGQGAYGIVW
jgi:hypothetical protein